MTKDEVIKKLQEVQQNYEWSAKELKQRVFNETSFQPTEDFMSASRFEARASVARFALTLVQDLESTSVTVPEFQDMNWEHLDDIRPHGFDEYL